MNYQNDLHSNNNLLVCPNCGVKLRQSQMQHGYRLARCWNCGQLLRFVSTVQVKLRGIPSSPQAIDWQDPTLQIPVMPELKPQGLVTEQVKFSPYPNLQCPQCEHVNRDNDTSQQYCVNCGSDLKKSCVVCDQPLYVLDQFCSNCRNDQERAQFELEAFYWQRYNEAKRHTEAGRWQEAKQGFDMFFSPEWSDETDQIRTYHQARFVYKNSIAPVEGNNGMRLYDKVLDNLTEVQQHYVQKEVRKARGIKRRYLVLLVFMIILMSVISVNVTGNWWAIFLFGPFLGIIATILLILLLIMFGIS